MHSRIIALYATLLALSHASPPPISPAKKETHYLSTFDDLVPTTPILSLQDVGPYNGLDFNFRLISTGVNGAIVLGVVPPSRPNTAAYDFTTANPRMTTQYVGSVTDRFDFQSFYAGCVAATQATVASVATRCDVTVQGYRASELVAKQKFSFDKIGPITLQAPMKKFKLSNDFKDLDTVTFSTDYLLTELLSATLLDDMEYTVHYPLDPKEGGKDGGKGN